MNYLIIVCIWLLNFGISVWNAYAVGSSWAETKTAGGWPRFMAWMGWIMSASGFSWCYLIVLAIGAHELGVPWFVDGQLQSLTLPTRETIVAIQIGYLLIIPGILFSGVAIMLDSWARAWRERTFSNMGTAAWNTYAQIHNTYEAIHGFGDAFASVAEYFTSRKSSSDDDDDKNGGAILVLMLAIVALALLGGVLTTSAIVSVAAGRTALPAAASHRSRR